MRPNAAQGEFRSKQLRRKLTAQQKQQDRFDAQTERMVKAILREQKKTK